MITRRDAEVLIPQDEVEKIVQGVITQSKALSLFKRLPNMTTGTEKISILNSLPLAYFQTADTALKNYTEMSWKGKYIYAEEIAVIVPIPEAVLDDAKYDLYKEIKPRVIEAFGKVIDSAIFTGQGKPSQWREGLVKSINQVGAVVEANGDLYAQVSDAMGKVEESGYNVNGMVGGVGLKKAFRDLRDTNGNPLLGNEIDALPRAYIDNGAWDKSLAKLIVGDFTQAVYAIRQDVTFKVLQESVIQDPSTGKIIYNLGQQDMVAIRCVMRLGWEIPNPVNALAQDESVRFPFALVSGTATIPSVNKVIKVTSDGTKAIEGVEVTLGGNVAKTRSDGTATFKVTSGQSYNYVAFKKGYKPFADSVVGEATTTTITLGVDTRASLGTNPASK